MRELKSHSEQDNEENVTLDTTRRAINAVLSFSKIYGCVHITSVQ
jgi:hypothetical protein